MSITDKVVNASIWSSLTEVIAKIVSPLTFLVLTRILSPSDYGIVAVATTLLTFIYIVSDLGTSKYIIQFKKESLNEQIKTYNAAFTLNFIIGAVLFLFLFLFSKEIANLFNESKADLIIKVMSLQIIFYSLSSVQNALKRKYLDFKFLFYTRLVTIGAPAILSIPFALMGSGVWALVIGSIAGAFFNTIILWRFSDWKPNFLFDKIIFKDIISNSIWNTIEEIFIWIPIFFDTYLISKFFTSKDLGLFTTSRTVYNTLKGLLLAPLLPVLYSAFSSISDSSDYNNKVLFSHKIIFTLSSLSCTLGFVYSELIEFYVFNEQWKGISYILKWTFLLLGCTFFNEVIIQALRAKGYFKLIGANVLVCTLLTVPFLYYSVNYGIIVYAITRYGTLYFRFPYIFYKANKLLKISFKEVLLGVKFEILSIIILVSSSIVIDYTISNFSNNILLKTIISFLIIILLFFRERKIVLFLKKKLLNKIKK